MVGVSFQLVFFGVLLFAPVGSLSWSHAMSWLIIYAAMAFCNVFVGALGDGVRLGSESSTDVGDSSGNLEKQVCLEPRELEA